MGLAVAEGVAFGQEAAVEGRGLRHIDGEPERLRALRRHVGEGQTLTQQAAAGGGIEYLGGQRAAHGAAGQVLHAHGQRHAVAGPHIAGQGGRGHEHLAGHDEGVQTTVVHLARVTQGGERP